MISCIKKIQAERGERLGGKPPYGYKKKTADSKEIVPDEETAPVVQYIFNLYAGGKGPSQIARILSDEKILTPAHYSYRTSRTMTAGMDMDRPYAWNSGTISHILCNMVYLHTMKSTTISFKNKTRIAIPENEQVIVKDTHPALVTHEKWDIVQEVWSHKRRPPKKMSKPNLGYRL